MYKVEETYKDFLGIERTEEFLFDLNEAEVVRWQAEEEGGMDKALERIVKAKSAKEIAETVADILLRSYGEVSSDGRSFLKTEEIRERFKGNPVFSRLYMRLATDDKAAAEFINGIMPKTNGDKPIVQLVE